MVMCRTFNEVVKVACVYTLRNHKGLLPCGLIRRQGSQASMSMSGLA